MASKTATRRSDAVSDDIKRLAAEWAAPGIIILGAVLVKALWTRTRRSWKEWVRHIVVAVFVGGVLNLYLTDIPDQDLGPGAKGAILALVVIQADHILTGLFKIGAEFANDPQAFAGGWLKVIRDAWRGRK